MLQKKTPRLRDRQQTVTTDPSVIGDAGRPLRRVTGREACGLSSHRSRAKARFLRPLFRLLYSVSQAGHVNSTPRVRESDSKRGGKQHNLTNSARAIAEHCKDVVKSTTVMGRELECGLQEKSGSGITCCPLFFFIRQRLQK